MPVVNGVVTLLPAPEGYVVNFDHPQRQAVPAAFWVCGVGSFLSALLMAQRLYTKAFLVGRLQLDDLFLLLAWLTSITTIALCTHMFAVGAGGVHAWEIPIEKFHIFMMDVFLAAPIYTICGSFAKVSLLIFYMRLSPQRWFKWAVWITLGVIISYSAALFFALIFACDPIAMSWDVTVTEGTCIDRPAIYIATAVANIVSDVMIFSLPIPIVVKLQIPRRQKIGLFFIFAVGSLTVVTSLIRVSLLPAMLTSLDQTWAISYASLWIIVEANLLIICAALPTLRKFFRHVAPKIIGESTYAKGSKKSVTGSTTISRMTIGGSNGRRNRNGHPQPNEDDGEAFDMERGGGDHSASRTTPAYKDTPSYHDDVFAEQAINLSNAIIQTRTVTVEVSFKKKRPP
ncbi:Satratoxin biosynthesis SC1 cluster protein 4 [Colletotrichum siamense]|nr:Satratoxin biosynthesis SC1 cluster protein 4 [Colletotrichum siamense]